MTANSRIEDLRRRVQKDPSSIAFAQLAEECRRAGGYQEAVDTCRAGLAIHPGYLSARVTLGRALIELGTLDEAEAELSRVLENAPENLAAIRGLAEIGHRRGDLPLALRYYRTALSLARNDPDLEQTIADLTRQVEPPVAPPKDGLSLQHMQSELLKLGAGPTSAARAAASPAAPPAQSPAVAPPSSGLDAPFAAQAAPSQAPSSVDVPPGSQSFSIDALWSVDAARSQPPSFDAASVETLLAAADLMAEEQHAVAGPEPAEITAVPAADAAAARTIEALERWLDAIHVARAGRAS